MLCRADMHSVARQTRRSFVRGALAVGLGLAATGCRLGAAARSPKRTPRLGFLALTTPADYAPYLDALRDGLRQLGYVDGQNIRIVYRFANPLNGADTENTTLIQDAQGAIYGTTRSGGTQTGCYDGGPGGALGCGVVFKLTNI